MLTCGNDSRPAPLPRPPMACDAASQASVGITRSCDGNGTPTAAVGGKVVSSISLSEICAFHARVFRMIGRHAVLSVPISIPPAHRRRHVGRQRLGALGFGSGAAARLRRSRDRKSTRLNSSHVEISYAVFCLKKKKK